MADEPNLETLTHRPGAKWALAEPGVIPAWVADMDFPVAEPIRDALRLTSRTDLGYPAWDDRPQANPLRDAFAERMRQRYGFRADANHVQVFTEVIQAVQAVLHVTTRPGDAVAMHTPGYSPFLETLADMDRRLVPIPMLDTGTGWSFDPDRFADDVVRHGCRTLLLVNPHNPTGRAFTRDELAAIADTAERHDLLVISDEIHSDLTFPPHQHIPFGSLSPEAANRTVTLASASKAFNLAGLRCCVAHIGHEPTRRALATLPPLLLGQVSSLSVQATITAWQQGDDWLKQTLATLDHNRKLIAESLPAGIGYHVPDATYLAWLDCRTPNLDGTDPTRFFRNEARVMLSHGPDFGPGGEGFVRLNFATFTPLLDEILQRMQEAIARSTA